MNCETFLKLSEWLQKHEDLKQSQSVSVRQKLIIFLLITEQELSQRDAMKIFQHSLEMIFR